jgi:3-hydroxyisobutyrate dehydrogenase-like beta-hydroxyacid dehydrogenase
MMAPIIMWIGLGNIGRAACQRLVSQCCLDSPLVLYNRTAQKSNELAASLPSGSISVVSSIKQGISQVDIIFTCLSNGAAVESTYQSIISGMTTTETSGSLKGKTFIGIETVHPDTADKLASTLAAHGAAFIACPVLGPPAAAAAGQLVAFPAGSQAALSRVVGPYVKGVLARAAITFPDRPCGTGPRMKIIANTFTLNAAVQLAEAFTLAEKVGIEPEQVGEFVELCLVGGSAADANTNTNPFHVYAGRMLRGAYWRESPTGGVALGFKDAGLAVRLAGENGATVRNPGVAMEWCKEVLGGDGRGRGEERGDIAGIYGAVREKAGLKFENGY